MIKLLPNNVGATVTIEGREETISHVLSDGKFKILRETQAEGGIVNHYSVTDIQSTNVLNIRIDHD
jgi:hypothetical protein